VLIEILGRNGVASGSGFTRKRQVVVVALLRIAEVWSWRWLPPGLGLLLWFGCDARDQRRWGLLALRPSFIEQSLLFSVSLALNVTRSCPRSPVAIMVLT